MPTVCRPRAGGGRVCRHPTLYLCSLATHLHPRCERACLLHRSINECKVLRGRLGGGRRVLPDGFRQRRVLHTYRSFVPSPVRSCEAASTDTSAECVRPLRTLLCVSPSALCLLPSTLCPPPFQAGFSTTRLTMRRHWTVWQVIAANAVTPGTQHGDLGWGPFFDFSGLGRTYHEPARGPALRAAKERSGPGPGLVTAHTTWRGAGRPSRRG